MKWSWSDGRVPPELVDRAKHTWIEGAMTSAEDGDGHHSQILIQGLWEKKPGLV